MTYTNQATISGFSIVSRRARDSSDVHHHHHQQQQQQQQRLAKCVRKLYSVGDVMNSSCYTATLAVLRRNQLVYVRNNELFHRRIVTSPQSSFWGVYKIASLDSHLD